MQFYYEREFLYDKADKNSIPKYSHNLSHVWLTRNNKKFIRKKLKYLPLFIVGLFKAEQKKKKLRHRNIKDEKPEIN